MTSTTVYLIFPPGDWEKLFVAEIDKSLKLTKEELTLEESIARTSYRGGYNDAMGIRKDLFPVICRGSAFVFSCKTDYEDTILDNLPELLNKGIGARREEGFGRISFCDQFHIDRIEQK
jgi:hypothetical protein